MFTDGVDDDGGRTRTTSLLLPSTCSGGMRQDKLRLSRKPVPDSDICSAVQRLLVVRDKAYRDVVVVLNCQRIGGGWMHEGSFHGLIFLGSCELCMRNLAQGRSLSSETSPAFLSLCLPRLRYKHCLHG